MGASGEREVVWALMMESWYEVSFRPRPGTHLVPVSESACERQSQDSVLQMTKTRPTQEDPDYPIPRFGCTQCGPKPQCRKYTGDGARSHDQ